MRGLAEERGGECEVEEQEEEEGRVALLGDGRPFLRSVSLLRCKLRDERLFYEIGPSIRGSRSIPRLIVEQSRQPQGGTRMAA